MVLSIPHLSLSVSADYKRFLISRCLQVQLHGGRVATDIVEGVTHVVVCKTGTDDWPPTPHGLLHLFVKAGVGKDRLLLLKNQLLREAAFLVSYM